MHKIILTYLLLLFTSITICQKNQYSIGVAFGGGVNSTNSVASLGLNLEVFDFIGFETNLLTGKKYEGGAWHLGINNSININKRFDFLTRIGYVNHNEVRSILTFYSNNTRKTMTYSAGKSSFIIPSIGFKIKMFRIIDNDRPIDNFKVSFSYRIPISIGEVIFKEGDFDQNKIDEINNSRFAKIGFSIIYEFGIFDYNHGSRFKKDFSKYKRGLF